jgi:hypothetical protein
MLIIDYLEMFVQRVDISAKNTAHFVELNISATLRNLRPIGYGGCLRGILPGNTLGNPAVMFVVDQEFQ